MAARTDGGDAEDVVVEKSRIVAGAFTGVPVPVAVPVLVVVVVAPGVTGAAAVLDPVEALEVELPGVEKSAATM